MIMAEPINLFGGYGIELQRALSGVQASGHAGKPVALDAAVSEVMLRLSRLGEGRVIFIGNGGSASIASHMAIDFQKNGGFPAMAFNDGAALTCLGNDLGFSEVFAAPLAAHTRPEDILFALSSSGRSTDILKGVAAARERGAFIVTLSGFAPDNPLRSQGDMNFYVDSTLYGFVEICHLAVCHAMLDMHMKLVTAMGQPATIAPYT